MYAFMFLIIHNIAFTFQLEVRQMSYSFQTIFFRHKNKFKLIKNNYKLISVFKFEVFFVAWFWCSVA